MHDEQLKNPPDVMVICDAYESGVGHGLNDDGLHLGRSYFASTEEADAYDLGYEKGKADRAKPKTTPIGYRLVKEDYQLLFNAIGEAVSRSNAGNINISVRSFWEYLDKHQPNP